MESKICMNALCRKTTTEEWKKGWPLRSGGFADLCYNCGSAYKNSGFCDMFHKGESGWRDCSICAKSVHCGCVASMYAFEHLDFGGIGCVSCAKNSQLWPLIQPCQIQNGFETLNLNNVHAFSSTSAGNIMVKNIADDGELTQLYKVAEVEGASLLSQSHGVEMQASSGKVNGKGPPSEEVKKILLNANQQSGGISDYTKAMNGTPRIVFKETPESLPQPSLSINLGPSSRTPNFLPSPPDIKSEVEGFSFIHQGQRSRLILPKPQKSGSSMNSEANKSTASQIPIARPPTDGRGKTLLLPRYWPRISDKELQQISGNLNSAIVPLFEKVLSASDAGRIGRLVLPKACAEAYFPHISQSEGISLKIQDIKGKEWTFQFRFWPNNNSRMYVLEGVTPCIQSMQLQAGDTVIFSRRDPEGKLVIGFRKASNSTDTQVRDSQTPDKPNGNRDAQPKVQPEHSYSSDGNIRHNSENNAKRLQPMLNSEKKKKKTRNIGSKSKRLLMHSEDAQELRLTWEEAQGLLRPPPSVKPSIVIIEDLEFEEYDEPPIFGKRTVFTARESGEQDQWAQCDDCSKWRRLPVDVLLPPKWTCSDNAWDPSRCSCSATDELNPKELDHLFRMCKDLKKRKCIHSNSLDQDCEPSGLDALATAAVLGDSMGEPCEADKTSNGATTKHPRHRPGCSCIVCVQPPSGKGKHKSTCTCNVCMTVKRRFKTLMLRKKKRQSECEAKTQQKDHKEEDVSEKNVTSKHSSLHYSENGESSQQLRHYPQAMGSSNRRIDLNIDPEREDMQLEETGLSMIS